MARKTISIVLRRTVGAANGKGDRMEKDLENVTMMTYVRETPEQVEKNVNRRKELVAPLVSEFLRGGYGSVLVIACGSSANASRCAAPFMRKYLGIPVVVTTPGAFLTSDVRPGDDTLCFVVSQSGCSTNSLAALDRLRSAGRRAVGITGNLDSDFRDHADLVVDYGVGIEYVGYVTKGVTTLALFLTLFSLEASHDAGRLSDEGYDRIVGELELVPERHRTVQAATEEFYSAHLKDMLSIETNYVIGFDQAYGIACEGALKFGETMKVPSFAFEAEEFNHGPNLQLNPSRTVFVVDDMNLGSRRAHELYDACRCVTDHAYLITCGDADEKDDHVFVANVGKVLEPTLSPLYLLPFFQIVAHHATDALGRWDDFPLMRDYKHCAPSKTEKIKDVMPLL